MEFAVKPDTISSKVTRTGADSWDLEVASNSLVKLFYAEGNQKYLLSDNDFALSPDALRRIGVTLLERMTPEEPTLEFHAMDSSEHHTFILE